MSNAADRLKYLAQNVDFYVEHLQSMRNMEGREQYILDEKATAILLRAAAELVRACESNSVVLDMERWEPWQAKFKIKLALAKLQEAAKP